MPGDLLYPRCEKNSNMVSFAGASFLCAFSKSNPCTSLRTVLPVLPHTGVHMMEQYLMHLSDIFISGKVQPYYGIQLNSHFCPISWSHFFNHFSSPLQSALSPRNNTEQCIRTVLESLLSLKHTLQMEQGLKVPAMVSSRTLAIYPSLAKAAMH